MPTSTYPIVLVGSEIPLGPYLCSFETGEVGALWSVKMPFRCNIKAAHAVVQKTIAATDDGTVTISDESGNAICTLTATHDLGAGSEAVASVFHDEYPIEEGKQIKLLSAKATAGGRVLVELLVEVLPSHTS